MYGKKNSKKNRKLKSNYLFKKKKYNYLLK